MHRRRYGSPLSRSYETGFTIIELMVTIGIIVLLIGLLFPVIGKVRRAAYNTDSMNFISVLQNAITRYHQDFSAYPGPFSNNEVSYGVTFNAGGAYPGTDPFVAFGSKANNGKTVVSATPSPYDVTPFATPGTSCNVTMAENLVLGLLGGLKIDNTGALVYAPEEVGQGPMRLSALPNVPHTRTPAYVEATHLSWRLLDTQKTGHFFDEASDDAAHTGAADSVVPEFLDSFPSGMPILYLRARRGVNGPVANFVGPPAYGTSNNPVITDSRGMSTPPYRLGTYDLAQVLPYTSPNANNASIGESKRIRGQDYIPGNPPPPSGNTYTPATPGVTPTPFQHGLIAATPTDNTGNPLSSLDKSSPKFCYPYDAYAYFVDPGQPGSVGANVPAAARQKDGYILISAGIDRVYGTNDDITTFGDVAP